jgi:hypothetical protein
VEIQKLGSKHNGSFGNVKDGSRLDGKVAVMVMGASGGVGGVGGEEETLVLRHNEVKLTMYIGDVFSAGERVQVIKQGSNISKLGFVVDAKWHGGRVKVQLDGLAVVSYLPHEIKKDEDEDDTGGQSKEDEGEGGRSSKLDLGHLSKRKKSVNGSGSMGSFQGASGRSKLVSKAGPKVHPSAHHDDHVGKTNKSYRVALLSDFGVHSCSKVRV